MDNLKITLAHSAQSVDNVAHQVEVVVLAARAKEGNIVEQYANVDCSESAQVSLSRLLHAVLLVLALCVARSLCSRWTVHSKGTCWIRALSFLRCRTHSGVTTLSSQRLPKCSLLADSGDRDGSVLLLLVGAAH